jgi:VWFA-related protein
LVVALFLLVLHATVPLEAQDESADTAVAEPYFESVNVEIVNVDVWVTDKKGDPVPGLTRDDFVVRRDGKEVEIANFYAVAEGRPVETAGPQIEPEAAPGIEIPALPRRAPEIAPEHKLWMIVYIDNYNVDSIERNRVLPDIYRFLGRSVDAGNQVMLVSYTRSLQVRQPFTDDRDLLVEALAEIKDDAGIATQRKREQVTTLEQIDETSDVTEALIYARRFAEEQMNGVGYTIDALERFIETLAGLPGRKALVHVSSGMPMSAGEEMFEVVAEKFGASQAYAEIPRHSMSREFERIGRVANAHRISFYTVDAGGLRGLEFGAAEYGGFKNPRIRQTLDRVAAENLQAPLRFIAQETGGRAIVNRNEILPALEEAAQDFGSFYSLGIESLDSDTGRYHSIEVKLREKRRDLRLRHRAGYRSKSPETRMRESLRSALMYAHQANPLGVQVRWGVPAKRPDSDLYTLPIQLSVPMSEVVLLPVSAGKQETRLQLYVGAVVQGGGVSEVDVVPIGLRIDDEHAEAARDQSLLHTHQLLLSRGRQKVGVAVLDVFGGESSIVTGFVQAGPVEPEEAGQLRR